jgi:LytS/YehU family sensor histidine kinase
VTIDVDDAARGVLVPALLLQPIVENAVKHGVAPFAANGHVEVRATVSDRRLRLLVHDTGRPAAAIRAPIRNGTGRGLQITRRRLDGAYGSAYHLSMSSDRDGTSVHLDLPAQRSDVA